MGFLHHQNNECGFKDHIDGQEVWDSISVANFGSFHITSLKFGNEISVVIFVTLDNFLAISRTIKNRQYSVGNTEFISLERSTQENKKKLRFSTFRYLLITLFELLITRHLVPLLKECI